MDYRRIYAEFIADRKAKPVPSGYVERHHIVPRSLGGSDDPDNIIALSAREHYFAHCCLAKIHGGKMWSALFAVAAMAKSDDSWRYFCQRRMVEASRVNAAKRRSEHMREIWASGEFTRVREYRPISDSHRARLSEAFTGRKMPKEVVDKVRATKRKNAKIYKFRHEDGRIFDGSQSEFMQYSGLSQSMVSYLSRGKIVTAKGWFIEGANLLAKRGRDATVRHFVNRDGEEFRGTRYQFLQSYPFVDNGSLSKLISGRLATVNGWRVARN